MIDKTVPLGELVVGGHGVRFEGGDDELASLSESIRRVGLLSPIVVEEKPEGLVIVAGHRRYAACRMAGMVEVPVRIMEADGGGRSEVVFAENFHRANPSPVELAAAIRSAIEEGNETEASIAAGFRRSVGWVKKQCEIVTWPPDILEALHARVLGVGAAGWLSQITDETYRKFLLDQGVENGLTERMAAAWVQGWRSMAPPEEVVEMSDDGQGESRAPVIPQAPCCLCRRPHRPSEMAYVGLCGECIEMMKQVQGQVASGA